MATDTTTIMDALYGEIEFSSEIYELMGCPLVQRLRRIRLSNIDSVSMPGIANGSRYEHSIGVAYLASRLGFRNRISKSDLLVIQAAGLIHDSGITPFGHLAEEALHYLGHSYHHENKWTALFGTTDSDELGGVDLQVYLGYESGLRRWANNVFGTGAKTALEQIFAALTGRGKYGKCIAGAMDLDNLDNVVRIAYHMGLNADRQLPLKIAALMSDSNETEGVLFADDAVDYVRRWLTLREDVYNHLMLAVNDFCGKAMILFATVMGYERNYISPSDWKITDDDLVRRLLDSGDDDISSAVKRWLLHDLWALSDLCWFDGDPPSYADLYSFSRQASDRLGRQCFAYRIKDKRTRAVQLLLISRKQIALGKDPNMWLLGVASPLKKAFTTEENQLLIQIASDAFSTRFLGTPKSPQNSFTLFETA